MDVPQMLVGTFCAVFLLGYITAAVWLLGSKLQRKEPLHEKVQALAIEFEQLKTAMIEQEAAIKRAVQRERAASRRNRPEPEEEPDDDAPMLPGMPSNGQFDRFPPAPVDERGRRI